MHFDFKTYSPKLGPHIDVQAGLGKDGPYDSVVSEIILADSVRGKTLGLQYCLNNTVFFWQYRVG
jgi:hypothetical protein